MSELIQADADHSPSIAALAAALAKAQGQMGGARKDSVNPHLKSSYADLASVWDACRDALSANGLAVVQQVGTDTRGAAVTTMLLHSSGEWLRSRCVVPLTKNDAQGFGSAVTYARRYALAAVVGVAPVDDDGHAATKAQSEQPEPPVTGTRTTQLKQQLAARTAKAPPSPPVVVNEPPPWMPEGEELPPRELSLNREPVRSKLTLINFGKSKGKHLDEVDDSDLEWLLKVASESVEKNDPKWHNSNVAKREAILAEIDRRS